MPSTDPRFVQRCRKRPMGSGIPLRLDSCSADMICQLCSHVSQQCRYRSVVTSQHLKAHSRSMFPSKVRKSTVLSDERTPNGEPPILSPTVIAVNKQPSGSAFGGRILYVAPSALVHSNLDGLLTRCHNLRFPRRPNAPSICNPIAAVLALVKKQAVRSVCTEAGNVHGGMCCRSWGAEAC